MDEPSVRHQTTRGIQGSDHHVRYRIPSKIETNPSLSDLVRSAARGLRCFSTFSHYRKRVNYHYQKQAALRSERHESCCTRSTVAQEGLRSRSLPPRKACVFHRQANHTSQPGKRQGITRSVSLEQSSYVKQNSGTHESYRCSGPCQLESAPSWRKTWTKYVGSLFLTIFRVSGGP